MDTTFDDPIRFHHMHAGAVVPFASALDDATTLRCNCAVKLFGMAEDKDGFLHDLRDGRFLQHEGAHYHAPDWWVVVCLIEDNLATLTEVHPAQDIYWDTVEYHYKPGRYHSSRM